MYRLISALIFLIVAVYAVSVILIYALPLLGFQFIEIESHNTVLGLSPGDSLLVYPKSIDKIKEGDIAAYTKPNGDLDIRKVAAVSPSSKIVTVVIAENKIKDITESVLFTNIFGIKIARLAGCAGLIGFLNNFMGKMVAALILAVFLILRFGLGTSKKRNA